MVFTPLSLAFFLALLALAGSGAAAGVAAAAPDYGQRANWVCLPSDEARCTSGLDAIDVAADGTRTALTFSPVPD
ncbi:hypothetical protein ACI4CU_28080, partial [Klebsiella pneumoniae]|uniref:hypothetical protein n=1 Tax=Klebsiella pneumoniae TaxID=573 RepID=UPI00385550B4